jgi:hypothetical protein
LTESKQNAATLVAAGNLTIPQIAKKAGVSQRTVSLWKKDKEFQSEIKRLRIAWRGEARTKGPANQDYRLRVLRDLNHRLQTAIRDRAKDKQMKGVPGGRTGLVTVTYKMQSLGEGRGSAKVPEYSIDNETPAQIAALLEQAAIEMGQWKVKVESETNLTVNLSIIDRLHAGRAANAQRPPDDADA